MSWLLLVGRFLTFKSTSPNTKTMSLFPEGKIKQKGNLPKTKL
jgi:hypothetical protein